jgi:hypothetical protein
MPKPFDAQTCRQLNQDHSNKEQCNSGNDRRRQHLAKQDGATQRPEHRLSTDNDRRGGRCCVCFCAMACRR